MPLMVKRLTKEATLPTIAHPGEDLAYDLYASETRFLPPNTTTKVPTGIAVEFVGSKFTEGFTTKYGGKIEGRSGLANKGVHPIGGLVDSGYKGELFVILRNTTDEGRYIENGDRVAQFVPQPVYADSVVEVEELSDSSRKDSGFGSSGT